MWSPQLPTGFFVPGGTQDPPYSVHSVSTTGLSPSSTGLSMLVRLLRSFLTDRGCCRTSSKGPITPFTKHRRLLLCKGFGLFPVRSPLLRELFLFLGVLRCFSSPAYPFVHNTHKSLPITAGGLPHSEFRIGLQAAPRSFSQRCHVLLRPWLPRHPPYALIRLIFLSASHLYTLVYLVLE